MRWFNTTVIIFLTFACTASAGPVCELTRPDAEGPYWIPGSPERSDLRNPGDGPLLDLHLSVVDLDCMPVPGAWIDIWHTDPDGGYDNNGWGYRGHHFTDGTGGSLLETVVPGMYPGRTRHIHVKVRGATPTTLTTQLYFPDVPENENDGLYHPDLEVTVLEEDAEGNMIAEFLFVLEETNPCPADVDGDGQVNVSDLLAVIAGWNDPYDVDDLLIVISEWGNNCP